MMVVCGDWDWGASDQPDIAMNRKTAPSIPANTFEPLMLREQLIGMCFLDFFIMVIVDVELFRFLLVRPTWCHSAAKSRWRAQALSQRSPPDTTRLFYRYWVQTELSAKVTAILGKVLRGGRACSRTRRRVSSGRDRHVAQGMPCEATARGSDRKMLRGRVANSLPLLAAAAAT